MNLPLDTLGRRLLFGALVVGLAAAVIIRAGITWLASSYGASFEPDTIRQAIRLEPGNARHPHRLGRVLQAELANGRLPEVIAHYQRAAALNPRAARTWLDLAAAYELAGETQSARHAFAQARQAAPRSAGVAWAHGNYLLRHGEVSPGFSELRRTLGLDPSPARLAVALAWQTSRDAERILAEALPAEPRFYLQALNYFVSQNELESALTVWRWLDGLKQPLEMSQAFPLLAALLHQERVREAQQVWQQALVAAGLPRDDGSDSLVWNGGFERELLNGGFGWRQQPLAGAQFDFDHTMRRSGARALCIVFDGTLNLDFWHLAQFVPVEPSTRYRFAAFLQTEGISTNSGLRFRLFDAKRPARLDLLTTGLTGTLPWSLQEMEFTTGADTRLLVIGLRRLPSRKFDNKLRGTVWVDDVSLTPVSRAAASP